MPRLYLPTKYTISAGKGESQKKQILIIPGAEQMSKSELQEILEWQQGKLEKEALQVKEQPKYSKKEVGQALNEYLKWKRRD